MAGNGVGIGLELRIISIFPSKLLYYKLCILVSIIVSVTGSYTENAWV